jgi:hypothetical protein
MTTGFKLGIGKLKNKNNERVEAPALALLSMLNTGPN